MIEIVQEAWSLYNEMAIFILFGFAVAGILYVLFPVAFVRRHLGGSTFASVVKASALGVPLPLCSCGVLPAALSLRRQGASKGATTSFLISTPQTGVDSIFVTYSLLGLVFALFRPLAALVSGIAGGVLVNLVEREEESTPAGRDVSPPEEERDFGARAAAGLRHAAVQLPDDVSVWLVIGILAAGVIEYFLPQNFFHQYTGTGLTAMLLMMLVGIPLYVCATASIPIAAALILKGLPPGAALVFLMTGPATNAATITLIWRQLGTRVAVAYLLTIAGCSLGFGFLLNWTFAGLGLDPTAVAGVHTMLPAWVTTGGAAVLGALIVASLWRKLWRLFVRPEKRAEGPTTTEGPTLSLCVKGMTCDHCAGNVRQALLSVRGAREASVDLVHGAATISGEVDLQAAIAAIKQAGYEAGPR